MNTAKAKTKGMNSLNQKLFGRESWLMNSSEVNWAP